MTNQPTDDADDNSELNSAEKEIIRHVRSLRFGNVEVHIHESKIVQVERRERFRYDERTRSRQH